MIRRQNKERVKIMKNNFISNLIKHIIITTFLVLGFVTIGQASVSAGEMTMHAIYVGRGDAILIESNNHYMLVDSGVPSTSSSLIAYLDKLNIPNKKLDYIVSTHPDGDHVGGFPSVFKSYSVNQAIYSPFSKESAEYYAFKNSLDYNNIPYRNPVEGESWKLGDATVQVIYDGSQGTTYNESSIVLRVTCDSKSILLTGDLPTTMERTLMSKGYNFKADILKVGHHGAAASSCADFLDAVAPQYAVISCEKPGTTVLPKASTLQRLARRFVKTYRTSDADVVIHVNNGVISTSNKENNGFESIKYGTITLSNNVFYDTGSAIKPTVTLTLNGAVIPPTEYKVTYSANSYTGTAKVSVAGTEVKYVSVCSTTFTILPRTETLHGSLPKLNSAKLTWSSQNHADGFTLQYSTSKKFTKNVKALNFNSYKTLDTTLSRLSFNKKYYFRVRAFKNNMGVGKWSKTTSLKTGKKPTVAKVSISSYSASKQSIKVAWKKLSSKYSAGYRIQYSTSKKFKAGKSTQTTLVKSYKKTSKKIKKLKAKTTYYIRIQGYNSYCNGKWSKTIKVRTK